MIVTFNKIVDSIKKLKANNQSFIIAIDGHGASGKSILSKELANLDSNISLIHFDDFYFSSKDKFGYDWHLPEFDYQRLEREVLKQIKENQDTKYQRFDWELNRLNDWIEVKTENIIIIEGVSSLNSNIRKYIDYKIWVDCPLKIRLKRAKERDLKYKLDTMDLWINVWIPRENNYVNEEKPYDYADLIIDGSGKKADINSGEMWTLNIDNIKATDNVTVKK